MQAYVVAALQGRPIGEAYSGYDDRSSLPIGLSPTLNYVAYAVYAHYAAKAACRISAAYRSW